jgi:hypothetical protein
MLSATFIDLIFIPLFFVVVSNVFAKKPHGAIGHAAAVDRVPDLPPLA